MEQTKIGIIGCGTISNIYCTNCRKFGLEVAACADIDHGRAQAKIKVATATHIAGVMDFAADAVGTST